MDRYRNKSVWYNSSEWGLHEDLLMEGFVRGRNFAVIHQFYPHPRYNSEKFDRYTLRIDISEWRDVYDKSYDCIAAIQGKNMLNNLNIPGFPYTHFISISNRSPGWWDNGYHSQLCFECRIAEYTDDVDHFVQISESGIDWDDIISNASVGTLLDMLDPVIVEFGKHGKPADKDDF